MENGFYLEHRTIHHSPPDMTKTLEKLGREFEKGNPHIFTAGRKAHYEVPDQIYIGLNEVQTSGPLESEIDNSNERGSDVERVGLVDINGLEDDGDVEMRGVDLEVDGNTSDSEMVEGVTWQRVSEFGVEVEAEDLEVE